MEAPPSANRVWTTPTDRQLHDEEDILLFLLDSTYCVDSGRTVLSPNYLKTVLITGGIQTFAIHIDIILFNILVVISHNTDALIEEACQNTAQALT